MWRIVWASVDAILPTLTLFYILWTWYIATWEIGILWFIATERAYLSGGLYILQAITLYPTIIICFVHLSTLSSTFGRVSQPLPHPNTLTEPYEAADATGAVFTCSRDRCGGNWKPPRTHHCSLCQACRIGFDHHCHWLGCCLTSSNTKCFLLLLWIIPLTLLLSLMPVLSILLGQFRIALLASRNDTWALNHWWSWLGSWIVFGGPGGRWLGGALLGYKVLSRERADFAMKNMSILSQPALAIFLAALLGILFGCFTLLLAMQTTWNVARGLSTVDALRGRAKTQHPRYICIPSLSEGKCDISYVFPVEPSERIYDRGWKQNMLDLFSQRMFPTPRSLLSSELWPKLNANLLMRLRKEKSSKSPRFN